MSNPPSWNEFQQRGAAVPNVSEELVERMCARLFASGEGYEFMKWLRRSTKDRVLGPDANANALFHLEGQRELCGRIEQLIERGLKLERR